LLTPQGAPFTQRTAERLAGYPALTFVCGRYEGFDERIRPHMDEEVSLGDFVLLGGEIAALAIIEATARLLPGVLGNEQSAADESHASFLLEYPQYTRPAEFRGEGIPDILMSGHHAKIAAWRQRQSVRRTLERRPDLLAGRTLTPELAALVASVREELAAEVANQIAPEDHS
jgi:tRNA (guanine37-N1)-methyltransferase